MIFSCEAILEILPKGETELLASLFQAQERIASGTASRASGGWANLAFLHLVTHVILAEVVMQRDLGALEHEE